MSYAIRNDGKGWRRVSCQADILSDELFSEIEPAQVINPESSARDARIPLLDAADIAINKADDNGLDSKALRQYRQALRDITAQNGFPDKINWPVLPK